MKKASISMLFEDGNPDGYKIIEKSNWTGKSIIFPRALFPRLKEERTEFEKAGVYILLGFDNDSHMPNVYIGEGDPVLPRLQEHYRLKDFWTQAIIFCSKDENLNKAHIQFIESKLVEKAKLAKRCILENTNTPTLPSLSEMENVIAENFLDEMLTIYSVVGIKIFDKATASNKLSTSIIYNIFSSKVSANGEENSEGFIILKDSYCIKVTQPSFPQSVKTIRDNLIKEGVLLDVGDFYHFMQDYQFSSPSMASSLILGRSSNGRIDWRDSAGKTLKDHQQELIK